MAVPATTSRSNARQERSRLKSVRTLTRRISLWRAERRKPPGFGRENPAAYAARLADSSLGRFLSGQTGGDSAVPGGQDRIARFMIEHRQGPVRRHVVGIDLQGGLEPAERLFRPARSKHDQGDFMISGRIVGRLLELVEKDIFDAGHI